MSLREKLASQVLPKDWAVANFVTNPAGDIQLNGSSRGLSNQIDRASLLAYRDRADVVLVSAVTARAEQYGEIPHKVLAIASERGIFDGIPALQDATGSVILITSKAMRSFLNSQFPNFEIIGLRKFTPRRIRRALKIRGLRRIVLEAGPSFTNWFVSGRALSELALSVVSLRGAFEDSQAQKFFEYLPAAKFKLTSVLQVEDTALTTWRIV